MVRFPCFAYHKDSALSPELHLNVPLLGRGHWSHWLILAVKNGAIWFDRGVTAGILKDARERVERGPEAAQPALARIAVEIDAEQGTGLYQATPKELAGIDRDLKAAREARFATDPTLKSVGFSENIALHEMLYTERRSKSSTEILASICSDYPTVYEAFQSRLRSVAARSRPAGPSAFLAAIFP
jgi:hypothetical protein